MSPTTSPANEHPIGAVDGLRAAVGGIAFVLRTPSVWPYALVPTAVMLLVACVLGALGVWGSTRVSGALAGEASTTWGQVGGWVLNVMLAVVAVLAALLLALAVAQPLSGFALEAIARAQERALTGTCRPQPSFLTSLVVSVKVVSATLLVGGSVLALLFLIGLLFPPAVIVTVPLKFLVGAWMLAWDFLDYPLGLRGLGVRDRLRWARRHLVAFTAFGLAWTLLLLVPGTFLLLLPMGVAGATRLVVEADGSGK